MIKFFIYIVIFCSSIETNAQHINEISNEVMIAFKKEHPNCQNVQWILKDSNFIAQFKENIYNIEKTYTKKGKVIKTVLEIEESYLPKSSADFIAKYYSNEKIESLYKIFDDSNRVFYQVEIKLRNLFFDMNGNYIYSKSKKID